MNDTQNLEATSNGAPQAARDSRPFYVTPELDLYESASELLVLLNVPGATPESINVQVVGSELQVQAARAASGQHADIALAHFERRFELPTEVDASSAVAELRDGVLEVRLQKSAAARRVKIPVRAN
jgi:HSP20 family molecular chaperone IbpA